MTRSDFVGVDGCKGGWFSVGIDRTGGFETKVFCSFRKLLGYYMDAKLILVDIPIGLPERKGGRDCDREARRLLGRPRGSSVFPTPSRQAVQQAWRAPKEYRGAVRTEKEVTGKGISKQAFAIAPKIAEVDELMADRGGGAVSVVREVHPELLFWALNGRKAMASSKKSKRGTDERLRVLQRYERRSPKIFDTASTKFRRNVVAHDDIIDALAAAVAAYHCHARLRTVPDCPPKDAKMLPMEIVYPALQGS
jgi:predicted RNase H-like nuclease